MSSLVSMADGSILKWLATDGTWSLSPYVPLKMGTVPWPPLRAGQWASIRDGHVLIRMRDARVLDWHAPDGTWRLWNYDPTKGDVLPGPAVAGGKWGTIGKGHQLVVMHDGRVLDWVPADGTWRLWNYDPTKAADILPDMVASGQWSSVRQGHNLIAMGDGRVLDWVPADGTWRLWNYDPTKADILPGPAVAQGQWASIRAGHQLVAATDGRVFDWDRNTETYRLWNYDPHKSDILPGGPVASGTLGPILSDILTFDVPSIGFPTGIACGGSSNLVLRRDGSYTYSGHFHDSGGLDYSVKNAWVVVDQAGRAYTFADEGKVEGTNHIFGAERDHDWATNGTNAEIANHWADLAGAASWRCTSEIDTDVVAMLKTLVDEIKQAGQVVAEVIAVVGPIVLLV